MATTSDYLNELLAADQRLDDQHSEACRILSESEIGAVSGGSHDQHGGSFQQRDGSYHQNGESMFRQGSGDYTQAQGTYTQNWLGDVITIDP